MSVYRNAIFCVSICFSSLISPLLFLPLHFSSHFSSLISPPSLLAFLPHVPPPPPTTQTTTATLTPRDFLSLRSTAAQRAAHNRAMPIQVLGGLSAAEHIALGAHRVQSVANTPNVSRRGVKGVGGGRGDGEEGDVEAGVVVVVQDDASTHAGMCC